MTITITSVSKPQMYRFPSRAASDVFFSTSENFLKKAAGFAASAGHISRPGSAKASGIWFIWSPTWTNFRKIPHSRHVRRCCQVLLSLVGKRFWQTGRSVSKTWQQHQRNAASVSSQRCLRITPAVGMLHIVTLWMHADTWGDVGLTKASFFGTQISSKSKTLKTATGKKPCHIENGNKIKEASVSGGNCWCASNFEKPSDYAWNWTSKGNLSTFRYQNKSRYIASWRTSGIPAMFHSLRMLKALRTKWLDSREKLGWSLTVFKAVKSVQRPIIQNALLLGNGEQKSSR